MSAVFPCYLNTVIVDLATEEMCPSPGDECRILKYDDYADVPVEECHGRMICVKSCSDGIRCSPANEDMSPYVGSFMYLREEVAERLQAAQEELRSINPSLCIRLGYAWRHPDVQLRYHEEARERARLMHPELDEHRIMLLANQEAAALEVAGHPCGAAVDVSIGRYIEADGGRVFQELNFGTPLVDFAHPELLPVFCEGLSEEQIKNRLLLRKIMMNQGFAPFDGEWWHFCFGDKEWAAYYGRSAAIYGPVSLKRVLGSDERSSGISSWT